MMRRSIMLSLVEAHSSERQSSRRRLMKSVKGRLDESLEHQQVSCQSRVLQRDTKSEYMRVN